GDDALRSYALWRDPRAGGLHQRARHVDAAGRPRGDEGDQDGLWRPRVRARGLFDEVGARPHVRSCGRGGGDDVRPRAPRGRPSPGDTPPEPGPRVGYALLSERGADTPGGRGALQREGARGPKRVGALGTRAIRRGALRADTTAA